MKEETIGNDDDGRRLDRVLRKAFPLVPPGAIAGAVRRGEVTLNGRRADNDTRVAAGDKLSVPDWSGSGSERRRDVRRNTERPRTDRPRPERPRSEGPRGDRPRFHDNRIVSGEWSIPVLERTVDWIALSKPAGLASHGAAALDEIVRTVALQEGWWTESLSFRPGPVHRLDRNTSGVQLFSLSTAGAQQLTEQIRERSVFKMYIAMVAGYLPRHTTCTRRLAYLRGDRRAIVEAETGQKGDPASRGLRFSSAVTQFYPLAFTADRTAGLIAAVPETGRTHQIRAHASALGIPLLGDGKYGGPGWDTIGETDRGPDTAHYMLHALVFATRNPAHWWSAPFPSAIFGLLRNHFGDLASLERRLNELLPLACATCSGESKIEL